MLLEEITGQNRQPPPCSSDRGRRVAELNTAGIKAAGKCLPEEISRPTSDIKKPARLREAENLPDFFPLVPADASVIQKPVELPCRVVRSRIVARHLGRGRLWHRLAYATGNTHTHMKRLRCGAKNPVRRAEQFVERAAAHTAGGRGMGRLHMMMKMGDKRHRKDTEKPRLQQEPGLVSVPDQRTIIIFCTADDGVAPGGRNSIRETYEPLATWEPLSAVPSQVIVRSPSAISRSTSCRTTLPSMS